MGFKLDSHWTLVGAEAVQPQKLASAARSQNNEPMRRLLSMTASFSE
jgi:hypothetical protein